MTKTIYPAALLAVLLLAGCTPTTPPTGSDDSSGGETGGDGTTVEANCLIGQWDLDVANYASQSAAFLTGLGIPIVDFAMSGTQVLDINSNGYLQLATDLTAGGTITVPGFTGPVSTHTSSVSAGDWSTASDGTLAIENSSLITNSVTTNAPEGVELGGVALTDVTGMTALCDETSLFLQGPDAPLGSYWTRR